MFAANWFSRRAVGVALLLYASLEPLTMSDDGRAKHHSKGAPMHDFSGFP